MGKNSVITERNFLLYAAKHYCNPRCLDVDEFKEDVAHFKYVKRLLRKYRQTGEIQERLLLNHLITIYNVFDISASNEMIFFKVDKDLWPTLKTFLIFLNYLPEEMHVEVPLDINMVNSLRKL
jgi:hypothetical protein